MFTICSRRWTDCFNSFLIFWPLLPRWDEKSSRRGMVELNRDKKRLFSAIYIRVAVAFGLVSIPFSCLPFKLWLAGTLWPLSDLNIVLPFQPRLFWATWILVCRFKILLSQSKRGLELFWNFCMFINVIFIYRVSLPPFQKILTPVDLFQLLQSRVLIFPWNQWTWVKRHVWTFH